MIVDIHTHIFPSRAFGRMGEMAPDLADIGKRGRRQPISITRARSSARASTT